MPQPLRKVRQRIPAQPRTEAGSAPRVLFHLPPPATLALVVIFAAAVGWAFFMGVMIGKGQNPEERVSALLSDPPQTAAPMADADAQPLLERPLLPDGSPAAEGGATTQAAPDGQDANTPTAQAPAAAPARNTAGKPASPATTTEKAATPKKSAYPFARPQGDGLAAWGIQQPAQGAAQAARPAGDSSRSPAQNTVRQSAEPLFDYVYQVAAFRDKADADRLRKTLEGQGMRARVIKSGKVQLVLVMLRGSEREADNLRQEMQNMGLGAPLRTSKKPVTPRGGKGR